MAVVAQLEALSFIDPEGLRKSFTISVAGLRTKDSNPRPPEYEVRMAITETG